MNDGGQAVIGKVKKEDAGLKALPGQASTGSDFLYDACCELCESVPCSAICLCQTVPPSIVMLARASALLPRMITI